MKRTNSSSIGIQRAGLLLFLVGLAIFLVSPGLGGHKITTDTYRALSDSDAIRESQRETLFAELAGIQDRHYGSVFAFQRDLNQKILDANKRLDGGNQIWDYDRGQYRFRIAREAATGILPGNVWAFFLASIVLGSLGAVVYFLAGIGGQPPGIRNNGVYFSSARSRGAIGIAIGLFLIGFYIALYFFPEYIANWIRLADPVSQALRGRPADQWFFYGLLYTFTILAMGLRMLINYRHSPYHVVRTGSVMFFQLGFAFLIPASSPRSTSRSTTSRTPGRWTTASSIATGWTAIPRAEVSVGSCCYGAWA